MIQYKIGKHKGYFTVHNLGIGIGQIIPFIRHRQQKEDKPIITNKLIILFAIIAIVKIAVLILWI